MGVASPAAGGNGVRDTGEGGSDGLVFASLSQVVADLLTSPGRAPSEGEGLLRWMAEHVRGWRAGAR